MPFQWRKSRVNQTSKHQRQFASQQQNSPYFTSQVLQKWQQAIVHSKSSSSQNQKNSSNNKRTWWSVTDQVLEQTQKINRIFYVCRYLSIFRTNDGRVSHRCTRPDDPKIQKLCIFWPKEMLNCLSGNHLLFLWKIVLWWIFECDQTWTRRGDKFQQQRQIRWHL